MLLGIIMHRYIIKAQAGPMENSRRRLIPSSMVVEHPVVVTNHEMKKTSSWMDVTISLDVHSLVIRVGVSQECSREVGEACIPSVWWA
jgi:hypothetical protein